MGKMKELYMKIHYNDYEYKFDDILATEAEEEEYQKFKASREINVETSKIEIGNERTIDKEKYWDLGQALKEQSRSE